MVAAACGSKSPEASKNTSTPAAAPSDSATPAPEPEKVTLKFEQFSGSGDTEAYLKQMIDEYTKQNSNVTVELQTVGYNDYFNQMMAKVAANQAPDVFELNYENFVSYAKKGALLPLDDIIKSSGYDTGKYNAMALDAFKADNKQFGLPNSFSNVLLFYNKDLFDKAEVTYPTNEWTWNDALEGAKKIRALDKNTFGYYRPVQFFEFFKVIKQNGGRLFNDDMTQFTVNTPENGEAVQYMVDMINKYNVMPSEEQLAGMGDWDLFKAGRLGMIVTGVWAIPDFTKNCTFNWDIAIEPGNKAKATHFFSNGYVLSKDTKSADTAFDLAAFLTSSKEAVNIRLDAGWELPPVTDPEVLNKYKALTPPSNRQAVFDSLEYLVTPPVIEQFQEFQDIVGKHLNTVVTKNATVDEALTACQKELEEKIKLK
jgi:multiple sugar transport system substrate-binding protein